MIFVMMDTLGFPSPKRQPFSSNMGIQSAPIVRGKAAISSKTAGMSPRDIFWGECNTGEGNENGTILLIEALMT